MEDENAPTTDAPEVPDQEDAPEVALDASAPATEGEAVAAADVLATFSQQEWAQELVRDQEENAPYAISQADIDGLPIEAKRILAALALRGKQAEKELDDRLAQVQAQTEAAKLQERNALQIQADALKWVNSEGVAKFIAAKPPGEQPDPDSPEGVEWLIDQGVQKRLAGFIEVIKQAGQERNAAAQQAEVAASRKTREGEISAYMDKHAADFENDTIYQQIHALTKKGIKVEEAHELVTSRLVAADLRKSNQSALDDARARVVRGGSQVRRIPELPKEVRGNTELESAWYDAHPDALKRDLERHERGIRH
jgi:hypothetical protein